MRRSTSLWRYVLAAVLACGLSACASDGDAPRAHTDNTAIAGTETAVDPGETWCASRPEPITCLHQGGKVVGVVVHPSKPSQGLVFWDPGGPGLGLPDSTAPLQSLVPRTIRPFDVLLMVEPWVSSPPSAACLEHAYGGSSLASECLLPSLVTNGDTVEGAIQQATARLDVPFVGAYLQSFGATRSQFLLGSGSGLRPKWAVLESPGPPVGTSADLVMRERRRATIDVLTSACGSSQCRRRGAERLQAWADSGLDDASPLEIGLGLIALATLPDDNAGIINRLQSAFDTGRVPADLVGTVRRAGRLYEQRGTAEVRPSLIALWADVCPRLADWSELQDRRDGLLSAYAWVFRGCASAGTTLGPSEFEIQVPTLMLTGRDDAIVPAKLQRLWVPAIQQLSVIKGQTHFWDSSLVSRRVQVWVKQHT